MTFPLPRILLVLFVAVLGMRAAYADDAGIRAAKRHFTRGEKLFALGKFEQAIEAYQKAYDAKPLPAFLFNIGQCYRNLGDYDAAIFSFKKYLKLAPDAENRVQVEEYIAELEAEQEREAARRLKLDGDRRTPDRPQETADTPIYKKWWFWTGIAVVGAAGGVGIYAATRSGPPATTFPDPIVFN
jgi:tetratricopeptide (TPR) repeat protein